MTAFTDQEFVSGTTITSTWLNGINDLCNIKKGTTLNRPASAVVGLLYFDTTLATEGKPIWFTGTVWVDSTGTIV